MKTKITFAMLLIAAMISFAGCEEEPQPVKSLESGTEVPNRQTQTGSPERMPHVK